MKRVCAIFVMVSNKQKRFNSVSVVFVSIAWPKKTTPSPPTWLSVDYLGLKMTCSNGCDNVKSTWEIKLHKSCVHFQCFAQLFCSESTNSIDWQSIEHKKVFQKQWKMCTNVVLFSLTAQTEFSECWIDFQCCSQCFCWTTSKLITYWLNHKSEMISWCFSFFVACFFFLHDADWVWWLRNLSSMLHPMQLLLYLLFRCLAAMNFKEWFVRFNINSVSLCQPSRFSEVSVVLAFSASPSACPNISPFSVSVLRKWMKSKSVWSFVVLHWTHSYCDPEWCTIRWLLCSPSVLEPMEPDTPLGILCLFVFSLRDDQNVLNYLFVCSKSKRALTRDPDWFHRCQSHCKEETLNLPSSGTPNFEKPNEGRCFMTLCRQNQHKHSSFSGVLVSSRNSFNLRKSTLMGSSAPSEMMASARSTSCSTPCPIA